MATPLPSNEAPFSLADLVLATGGEVVREGDLDAVGVSTDTRTLQARNVFVALTGERFDGHAHLATAVRQGATALVVSRPVPEIDSIPGRVSVVRVADTLVALGDLGRAHRRRWGRAGPGRKAIAITGSAGKTTTRHAIASVLAALGQNVHASAGNLNNRVGAPVTLLGLTPAHDTLVAEIGMSLRGEIATLARIVEPDVGVVTLVSDAHSEGVGTVWDIAREKTDLFAALPPSGFAVANADDARAVGGLLRFSGSRTATYGEGARASVRVVERRLVSPRSARLTILVGGEMVTVETALLGVAGALACAAAFAVARELVPSASPQDLARAATSIPPNEAGRLASTELDRGIVVVDDAYNANPASMIAGVATASEIARARGARLVLVLGEMRELGERSEALHRAVGEAIAPHAHGPLFVVGGPLADALVAGAGVGARRFPSDEGVAGAVAEALRDGDVVFLKASNSIRLHRVADELRRAFAPAHQEAAS